MKQINFKDGLTYTFEVCNTQAKKYEIGEFIYKNTDNFVMNTMLYLWETRDWWNKHPILVCRENNKIIGIRACGNKGNILKSYYTVVDRNERGRGIGIKLLFLTLEKAINDNIYTDFCVTSLEDTNGDGFYKYLFRREPQYIDNEFGTKDLLHQGKIIDIYKMLLENKYIKNVI